MPQKFVSLVYYEGRLLAMTETGDIYELSDSHGDSYFKWNFEVEGPVKS